MTLPASFPMSMSEIAAEIGMSLPLSIDNPKVVALAGKLALPLSFSDLLGKTGHVSGNFLCSQVGSPYFYYFIDFADAPFFGGTLGQLQSLSNGTGVASLYPNVTTNWGNPGESITVKNNTTGVSITMVSGQFPTRWSLSSTPSNFLRLGQTDNFSVYPF